MLSQQTNITFLYRVDGLWMIRGMSDKELVAVRNKEGTGGHVLDDDEVGTGNKDNTMDSIVIQEDIGRNAIYGTVKPSHR